MAAWKKDSNERCQDIQLIVWIAENQSFVASRTSGYVFLECTLVLCCDTVLTVHQISELAMVT
jgi:hypothetical protein